MYYRKRTEGQNTFTINNDDQVVTGVPTTKFESTGEAQDALDYAPANSSTVYFTTDLSEMYNSTTVSRGVLVSFCLFSLSNGLLTRDVETRPVCQARYSLP